MDYIKLTEAAEKWRIPESRLADLCRIGKVPGAAKWGLVWMIPANAARPEDHRMEMREQSHEPMPKKSPFLNITELYHTPGRARECAMALAGKAEAAALFSAQMAYYRGDIHQVYEYAHYFLQSHSSFYAVVGAGLLLSLCALCRGDDRLWLEAKEHIAAAPCAGEEEKTLLQFWLAVAESGRGGGAPYPEWFRDGCFDPLPPDSYPAARFFYARYLYETADEDQLRMLPNLIEPLISQTHVEKVVIAELYLRLLCAAVYHKTNRDAKAVPHIDKAIDLALPDGLFSPLAEYRPELGILLDHRLSTVSGEALIQVKALESQMAKGKAKLAGEN